MSILKKNIFLLLLWLAALASPVFAHHSRAFYTPELVEVAGELVDVDWRNPHSVFIVKSVDSRGTETLWRIEGNSTFNYLRSGITRDLFNIGDQVKIVGSLSSRDDHALAGANMLLPGGREVLLWEDPTPRFSDEAILVTGSEEVVAAAASEDKGIFRVWSSPRGVYWAQQMAKQPLEPT